jgi:hypothetical protein
VFQRFHDFQNLVERMFSRKIIAMQTDWGGEYQKLNTFFQHIGISHHVSCPYAHQQNGSVERKHHHIVEVGLSLLAHASMPLKFWDEAFITTTYLINRLPSKVIDNQTPLERLLHQKPDYSMLRTFGCACWPNLRPYNTRKLQFCSKRCVFLGYSNIHKGFKCLDVSEGRVYISRDVIFDESVFPFHELHPNAGARLKEEVLLLSSVDQNSGDECANDSIMVDSSTSHKEPTVVFGDQEQNSASTDENSEQMQHYFMQGHLSGMQSQVDPGTRSQADAPAAAAGHPAPVPTAASAGTTESSPVAAPATTPAPSGGHPAPTPPMSTPTAPSGAPSASTQPREPTASRMGATQSSSEAGASGSSTAATAGGDTTPGSAAPGTRSSAATGSSAPATHPATRLQHGIRKPKTYTDGTIRYTNSASISSEPASLKEALANPHWKAAMDAEYTTLMKNKTWHLVLAPKGRNVIDCRWIFKVKYKADGSLERYKG